MITESNLYGYYSLLHVDRNASREEIFLAYVARCDSIKSGKEKGNIDALTEAADILMNANSREEYNIKLEAELVKKEIARQEFLLKKPEILKKELANRQVSKYINWFVIVLISIASLLFVNNIKFSFGTSSPKATIEQTHTANEKVQTVSERATTKQQPKAKPTNQKNNLTVRDQVF